MPTTIREQERQRFTTVLPKLVDKAQRSAARARDAARVRAAHPRERHVPTESFRNCKSRSAAVTATTLRPSSRSKQFDSPSDLSKEADALAEMTAAEDRDAIAGLQGRSQEDIERLSAAKGLDAERVKEVVLRTRLQLVGSLNNTLRAEVRNATQQTSQLRHSVQWVHNGHERPSQMKQAYPQGAYRD